ncbi:outer dynein arm docking complex protein oda-dc [Ectocarpus siliculosus]|uniref:Outer dynein arm docking complex protein oda-dc n=1 Tax=Ectocarpus siliculosus TaxID=2880 RepID=D7FKY3_ECTSI|nr:outer dynein arm docking complex protein oda-dc [Ectocarpus siliculosus]|eukprot:CBJ29526.1 outer dynein arm docking complex protein oda-dc [Ectocarpus siliculosus]
MSQLQDNFQASGVVDASSSKIPGVEVGSQQAPAPTQGGGSVRGISLPMGMGGGGGGGGGAGAAAFLTGGGLLSGKSVISVQSKRLADDVNYVYDRQILYTNKIQFQRSRIEDLTFRIAKAEKELEDKRKTAGPDNAQTVKGGVSTTEREIQRVENRLQQTLMKASMLDAANARRKECVNSLRREKMAEVKAQKRLVAELERARAICASTTRATQQMVDDKEKTRREIEVLKQEVVKDLESFREEFQGMTESLAAAKEATQESNAKLEYMTRSRPPGAGEDEEGESGQGGGAAGDASTGSAGGGPPGAGEVQPLSRAKRLHQQSIMSFWLILKKKNDLQAKAARVQELRAMLEKISAATSLTTLDDFVPVMLEAEDENYNLFKLINELNKEAGSKKSQQAVKLSLQQQIDRYRSTAKDHDRAYGRDVEAIKSIEESLISVFNKVGSSDKAASKQLIAMGVTDRNILLFLAQIEEQIDYIVQVYNAATDSTAVPNVRRPSTPVVNQSTGERVPSMCAPHPPSSDTIDDTPLGMSAAAAEEDADGAFRPINTARVAVSMKEQVLRMPQGINKAGGGGGGAGGVKGVKIGDGNFSGRAAKTADMTVCASLCMGLRKVGLPPEKSPSGIIGVMDSVQDSSTSGGARGA